MKLLLNNKLESICPDFLPLAPPSFGKKGSTLKLGNYRVTKRVRNIKRNSRAVSGGSCTMQKHVLESCWCWPRHQQRNFLCEMCVRVVCLVFFSKDLQLLIMGLKICLSKFVRYAFDYHLSTKLYLQLLNTLRNG